MQSARAAGQVLECSLPEDALHVRAVQIEWTTALHVDMHVKAPTQRACNRTMFILDVFNATAGMQRAFSRHPHLQQHDAMLSLWEQFPTSLPHLGLYGPVEVCSADAAWIGHHVSRMSNMVTCRKQDTKMLDICAGWVDG